MSDTPARMEIEIKLKLESFMDYLKLLGFLGQIESEEHHINGFFDTEDRKLAKAGWALRVRAENHRGVVTVKSIPTQSGLAVIRQEIEAEIGRGLAVEVLNLHHDVLQLPVMPVEFIKKEFPGIRLARLIQFENIRQKKLFKIGDYNYLLEVDKTEYSDGSLDYELEVELSDASRIETVEDHLRKLFASLGIPFEKQAESKFARALQKARIL
ncbi:MAG: CYTH domain-containing protein [Candidatus Zixiibacteriota bacterium]